MSTNRDRYGILRGTVPAILEQLGPVGQSLSRDVRLGIHHRIPNILLNPKGFTDWREFFCAYQASSLLKKHPGLSLGIDREKVACDKFLKSEEVCSTVNHSFRKMMTNLSTETVEALHKARAIVGRILGDFSWSVAIQYCDFGPGANVGVPRSNGHLCKKIGILEPTVTGECLPLLHAYMKYDPHIGDTIKQIRVVAGSKSTTVPKDARSNRFIAIEPLWNMFFQKGIGGMIRTRLRQAGVDLDNGQPVNQKLALRGSLDGSLATIDLSSASDTIAASLVEFLLPDEWYRAASIVRSKYCTLPSGETVFLKKFSSMGNGYTFELESLIFLALAMATTNGRIGRDVSVFGDDIITPSTDAPTLIRVLSEVGFKTNQEKTFIDGPFRESCGKHYFSGYDVTPFYLKKEISSYHDLLWLINSLRRLAYRFVGYEFGCDKRFESVWTDLVRLLPGRFQSLSCPDGYGDEAVVRDFDECSPSPKSNKNWVEGYTHYSLRSAGRSLEADGVPALISKLWYTRRFSELGEMSQYSRNLPSVTYRLRVVKKQYPRWTTLGPWVSTL